MYHIYLLSQLTNLCTLSKPHTHTFLHFYNHKRFECISAHASIGGLFSFAPSLAHHTNCFDSYEKNAKTNSLHRLIEIIQHQLDVRSFDRSRRSIG